jgi:hypothetical protein
MRKRKERLGNFTISTTGQVVLTVVAKNPIFGDF